MQAVTASWVIASRRRRLHAMPHGNNRIALPQWEAWHSSSLEERRSRKAQVRVRFSGLPLGAGGSWTNLPCIWINPVGMLARHAPTGSAPYMQGVIVAWSSSSRDARFNPGWERTRKWILERDHHRCQWIVTDWHTGAKHICGYPANEVDHKVRAKNGEPDDDSPSNLWALCPYHHKQKTARESGEARVEKRRSREEAEWYSRPAFR